MSVDISTASHLWIDAGALSGPPEQRHQVELAGEVIDFFDEASRLAQQVVILPPRGPAITRPLTHRGHSQGQWADIWRLGLPTLAMGGVEYVDQCLHFERRTTAGGTVYALEVAAPGSARANWWRRLAERDGVKAATQAGAGREYGYW